MDDVEIVPDHVRGVNPQYRKRKYVEVYPGRGVCMDGGPKFGDGRVVGGGGSVGGKRGRIRGWSKSARRRMREFLLTNDCPDRELYGVTLTIPGPVVSGDVARKLFKRWCELMCRRDWSAVWRMEVQQRGQLHWHLMAWCPGGGDVGQVKDVWFRCVRDMGCVVLDEREDWRSMARWEKLRVRKYLRVLHEQGLWRENPDSSQWFASRCLLPGAEFVCVKTERVEEVGPMLRYLQDHATKRKQHQVAEYQGRHWGVIGRKHFVTSWPSETFKLTDEQYKRVLRFVRRMCTPRIRDKRCPFGCRLGYRPSRGNFGRSVWFTRPDVIKRLCEFVLDTVPSASQNGGPAAGGAGRSDISARDRVS